MLGWEVAFIFAAFFACVVARLRHICKIRRDVFSCVLFISAAIVDRTMLGDRSLYFSSVLYPLLYGQALFRLPMRGALYNPHVNFLLFLDWTCIRGVKVIFVLTAIGIWFEYGGSGMNAALSKLLHHRIAYFCVQVVERGSILSYCDYHALNIFCDGMCRENLEIIWYTPSKIERIWYCGLWKSLLNLDWPCQRWPEMLWTHWKPVLYLYGRRSQYAI